MVTQSSGSGVDDGSEGRVGCLSNVVDVREMTFVHLFCCEGRNRTPPALPFRVGHVTQGVDRVGPERSGAFEVFSACSVLDAGCTFRCAGAAVLGLLAVPLPVALGAFPHSRRNGTLRLDFFLQGHSLLSL